MKVIIKDTPVNAVVVNDVYFISDADANRIINTQKPRRGRVISKDKLVDMGQRVFANNTLYFELMTKLDDCYHNNVIRGRK